MAIPTDIPESELQALREIVLLSFMFSNGVAIVPATASLAFITPRVNTMMAVEVYTPGAGGYRVRYYVTGFAEFSSNDDYLLEAAAPLGQVITNDNAWVTLGTLAKDRFPVLSKYAHIDPEENFTYGLQAENYEYLYTESEILITSEDDPNS